MVRINILPTGKGVDVIVQDAKNPQEAAEAYLKTKTLLEPIKRVIIKTRKKVVKAPEKKEPTLAELERLAKEQQGGRS